MTRSVRKVETSSPPITVMLAEDEILVRHLARDVLSSEGYRVLEAGDGQEAVEIAKDFDGQIDLLVTDIVMPRMSGIELTDALRRTRPGIPAVLLSGYPDRLGEVEDVQIPDCSFLPKPFRPSELLEVVRKAGAVVPQ